MFWANLTDYHYYDDFKHLGDGRREERGREGGRRCIYGHVYIPYAVVLLT